MDAVVDLGTLGLSAQALADRQAGLGGSDANIILGADEDRIVQLWKEKRGEAEAEDLSNNLAVVMGSYTEGLNAAWFTKQTGLGIGRRGAVLRCQAHDHMACTLDGTVISGGAEIGIWEAKHCGTFGDDLDLFRRYTPQLHHNMICTGMTRAWLSILRGNSDWVMFEAALDPDYAEALIAAESDFWDCVLFGTPPLPAPLPPVPLPVGVVEVDMSASNLWGHYAGVYIETKLAAEGHEEAKEHLKEMTPDGVSRAFGGGIEVKRTKAGALRINIERGD